MPVTHDPHYLENALDVLLRCKQVVNDMEYHVCVELVKAWDFALANGARQQLNLDQTIQLAVVRWKTRWQHTRQDWPYYSTSRLDHEISFDRQYGPVALA